MSHSGLDQSTPWVVYGKVLHSATSPDAKSTHVEKLRGAPRKYRLEEREPEVAFIDSAKLHVRYEDGSVATYLPNAVALQNTDGKEVRIQWGQSLEFHFPVSDSPDRRAPRTSEIEIVGYYQRINFTTLGNQESSERKTDLVSPLDVFSGILRSRGDAKEIGTAACSFEVFHEAVRSQSGERQIAHVKREHYSALLSPWIARRASASFSEKKASFPAPEFSCWAHAAR